MTEPATEEEIAEWAAEAEEAWDMSSNVVEALIARIRAEQASQATAREQAIRECITICETEGKLRTDNMRAANKGALEWGDPDKAFIAQGHKAVTAYQLAEVLRNLLQTGEETK